MPTGYTSDIEKGISFPQFAMQCARAFSALVTMRDEPMSAAIPEEFPVTTYHQERIAEAEKRLSDLKETSIEQAEQHARCYFDKAVAEYDRILTKRADLLAKYDAMLAKAQAWMPPTPDHQGLKDFMVQQIAESIKWDCDTKYLTTPTLMTGREWLTMETSFALRNLEYHRREHQAEVERTTGRTAWVKALKASL